MSCWTLWQRMPPRYQLTMRDARDADDQDTSQGPGATGPRAASRASSASPRSPRLRTPRGARRVGSARARLSGDGPVLTTSGVVREGAEGLDVAEPVPKGGRGIALLPRSSPYIHNMKNTMRINSARKQMNEGTFPPSLNTNNSSPTRSKKIPSTSSSSTTVSYTPKARATTAPAFPITKPANTDEYHRITSPRAPQHPEPATTQQNPNNTTQLGFTSLRRRQQQLHANGQNQQRGFSGGRSPRRPSSGYAPGDTRRLPVRTITPFGEATGPPFRAEGQSPVFHARQAGSHRARRQQQDCVIGQCQVAALYVDRGRVTFFRKTRPDVTQSVYNAMSPYDVSRDDGSYLAHLRKAYLSGVRDLPKMTRKEPDLEKHSTIRERMDYDRKVGRILEYYNSVDFSRDLHGPRPPDTARSSPSPSPPFQRGFRTTTFRRQAGGGGGGEGGPRSQEIIVIDGAESPSPRSPQRPLSARDYSSHSRESGGFVRINSKARLHDRHNFYLRTPGGGEGEEEGGGADEAAGSCVCEMCRLEMEVALMAQLHRDLGISVDAATAAQIMASLEAGEPTTVFHNNHQLNITRASMEGEEPTGLHLNHHVPGSKASSGQPPVSKARQNVKMTTKVPRPQQQQQQQSGSMSAVADEDLPCPTRPNSVSDTNRRQGNSSETAPSTNDNETVISIPKSSTDQCCPATGGSVTTSTQTPLVSEPSSLTVTMPIIEENSESQSVEQDVMIQHKLSTPGGQAAQPSTPDNDTNDAQPEHVDTASDDVDLNETKTSDFSPEEEPKATKDFDKNDKSKDTDSENTDGGEDGNFPHSEPEGKIVSLRTQTPSHREAGTETETARNSEPVLDVKEPIPEDAETEVVNTQQNLSEQSTPELEINQEGMRTDAELNEDSVLPEASADTTKGAATDTMDKTNIRTSQTIQATENNPDNEDFKNEPDHASVQTTPTTTVAGTVADDKERQADTSLESRLENTATESAMNEETVDGASETTDAQAPVIVVSLASDAEQNSSDEDDNTK